MLFRDVLLALLVVFVWGCNFAVIKFGLHDVSPLVLCTGRFMLAGLLIFFLPRPNVPLRTIFIYGVFAFILQFVLLFVALAVGISAGLASLLLQSQVFFTLLLAVLVLKEHPTLWQGVGASIALLGVAWVAFHLGDDINFTGFVLVLGAAIVWAIGNLVAKKMGRVNMLSVVAWASFLSWPPLLLVTVLQEGVGPTIADFSHFSWASGAALLYIVVLSTWFGYGMWNKLLSQYTVTLIAPFTLLVPVFGMLSSAWIFHESLPFWKLLASFLIILGLAINVFGARWVRWLRVH